MFKNTHNHMLDRFSSLNDLSMEWSSVKHSLESLFLKTIVTVLEFSLYIFFFSIWHKETQYERFKIIVIVTEHLVLFDIKKVVIMEKRPVTLATVVFPEALTFYL